MGLSLLLLAGGCAKGGAAGDLSNNGTKNTDSGLPKKPNYTASKYVTLGDYKGIEVSITKRIVTDTQVDDAINQEVASVPSYEDIKDKTVVEDGDVVNIDYEGIKDGVAFQGGTAKGAYLEIGSNQFIDGFESGLIGKKVGEKVKLDVTFPKEYSNAELAGKPVVFNVTINKIVKEIPSVLSDEFVTNNTTFKTVDEYKKAVRAQLETNNDSSKQTELEAALVEKVMSNAKYSEIPKKLTEYYKAYMNYQVEQTAKQYNMDAKTYLSQMGITEDKFNEDMKEYAETQAKQELTLKAIAEAEKVEVTDKEFDDTVKRLTESYNNTEEELFAMVTKEELRSNLVLQKVFTFLKENSKITEVEPTPSPTPTTPASK